MTAEPTAANTAGQQRPTSASGTTVRVGASGAPNVAVTPVWSATRSGSQSTVTVTAPSLPTSGSASGPSTPAAIASTDRMAVEASSVVTTGAPPSTVVAGKVNLMSIQVPDSGTLRTTCSSPSRSAPARRSAPTSSRAPVAWLVAERLSSCTNQSAGLGDAVYRVGRGATGPQHVRGVEYQRQRAGDIGTALTPRQHLGRRAHRRTGRRRWRPARSGRASHRRAHRPG